MGNSEDFRGNKGEWSEVYIFLKLLNDGKLFIADRNMNALKNVFLNIVKILREQYEYHTGQNIHIIYEGKEICSPIALADIAKYKNEVWNLIRTRITGSSIVATEDITSFFNSMKISKLKAPAVQSSTFFGGTQDITMEVMDYRSGINSIVGFSCKSSFSAEATLFNASKDNTNFLYEVSGNINDELMNTFNNLFATKKKTNKETGIKELVNIISVYDRMNLLVSKNCKLKFVKVCSKSAERNLILSGGKEMPELVAELVKYYYYTNLGQSKASGIRDALHFACKDNISDYDYPPDKLMNIYERKIGTLLYDMFTGMRFASEWDGKSSVNGGYIIVKDDGDVVAYHSTVTDEFKTFLIDQLGFETPSAQRHDYMQIYKEEGKYFIKLNLQIRFKKINLDKYSNTNTSETPLFVTEN